MLFKCMGSRYGDIIKKAEPHCLITLSMVARWPDGAECIVNFFIGRFQ